MAIEATKHKASTIMIGLMKGPRVENPDARPDLTHIFVMHPVQFYDFAVEMADDDSGIWKDTSLEGELEYGGPVKGYFADIPVISSDNAPIYKIHFMKRTDVERCREMGMAL